MSSLMCEFTGLAGYQWCQQLSTCLHKKSPNKTNTHSPPHNFAEPAQGLAYFIRSRVTVMQSLFKIKRYWALELRFQREPLEPQCCHSLISANAARVAETAPLPTAAVAAQGPGPRSISARSSQPLQRSPPGWSGSTRDKGSSCPLSRPQEWQVVILLVWQQIGCSWSAYPLEQRNGASCWHGVLCAHSPHMGGFVTELTIFWWSACKPWSVLHSYVWHGNRLLFPKANNLNLVVPDRIPRPKSIPTHLLLPKSNWIKC